MSGVNSGARRRRRQGTGGDARSPGFIAVSTGWVWLTTGIAAVAAWPIYQSPALALLVVLVTVAGSLIAIAGAVFRLSSLAVLLLSLLSYFMLGVPLAVPDRAVFGWLPSPAGLLELLAGTALAWKQLLTVSLPVGSYQGLLIPAFLLVLATVVVSLSVALRARRRELAVCGPIALFLAFIALGPTRASWPLELSLGLGASVLFWLIWHRWYRRRAAIMVLARQASEIDARLGDRSVLGAFVGFRALASAGLIMAIAGGASIGATSLAPPSGDREVLRSSIVQPFDARDYPSPLAGFRAYEQSPRSGETLFTVQGLPDGARVRIATLDTYDGIVYAVGNGPAGTSSGAFARVPFALDQSDVNGTAVRVTVTTEGYEGVWLPTVGQLESVDFVGEDAAALKDSFFYNDATGTAAVVHGLASGDSYALSAVLPKQPSDEQLSGVEPGSAVVPAPRVLPDELSRVLDRYVGNLSRPGDRLAAMIAGLRTDGYVSHGVSENEPPSRSGHAADRITELLTDQIMVGDQEQYAVTAALMATELGFPARVVFGFAPPSPDSTGTSAIRGSDVTAWIQVNTTRFGWIDLDPTPAIREIPPELPEEPAQVARPQSPVQPPPQEPVDRRTQNLPDSTLDDPEQPNQFLAVVLVVLAVAGWVGAAVAIASAPFLAIIAAKARRRVKRRHAPTATGRISGGWREFEDAVVDHGFLPPAASTRREVAETVGGTQPLVLAAVADRAAFAPEAARPEEADQVWRSVRELRAALGVGLSRWQRVKALISVRSLGGYSGKGPSPRRGSSK